MICQNFWCKGSFENSKDQTHTFCPHCRSNQEYTGHVEIVKQNVSIGYNIKELMEIVNKKKNNNKKKDIKNTPET